MTVEDKFNAFDAANPGVYSMFKVFVYEAMSRGAKRLSSKLVIERIRWETSIATSGAGWNTVGHTKFLIDNRFTCWYARKFIRDFPNLADKFELREIKTP